jgi:SNF2 family DNA or RNA helicase
LIEECHAEGFKVVVFSYFLDVLDAVAASADGAYRIDGKVPPAKRLQLIDDFSSTEGFALLASQVVAGGVGLNLQAANVVILMEPQVNPTTEWQAIARVYRMGQTRTVLVHRLLAQKTIDEDLFELVSQKVKAFNAFADESSLKDESDIAVASTEAELEAVLRERIRARQLSS